MIKKIVNRYQHSLSCPYCGTRLWNPYRRLLAPWITVECPECKHTSSGSAFSVVAQILVACIAMYIEANTNNPSPTQYYRNIGTIGLASYLLTGFILIFIVGPNKKGAQTSE